MYARSDRRASLETSTAHRKALGVAAATGVAVKEVFPTTDSTDSALIAVELLPGQVIIEEVALQACPGSKGCLTLGAVSRNGLPRVTHSADHFFDVLSIQLVSFCRILHAKLIV